MLFTFAFRLLKRNLDEDMRILIFLFLLVNPLLFEQMDEITCYLYIHMLLIEFQSV